MTNIKKIISWTRFGPFVFAVLFFILLTFPGKKNFKLHINAGYFLYVIIGSCIIIFIHAGIIYLFQNHINKTLSSERDLFNSLIDRLNFLVGILVVLLFEGLCSDCFQYRQWAYGVNRAEAVFEKIDNDWNLKQIEKSQAISKKLEKPLSEYTQIVYSKWQKLKSLQKEE